MSSRYIERTKGPSLSLKIQIGFFIGCIVLVVLLLTHAFPNKAYAYTGSVQTIQSVSVLSVSSALPSKPVSTPVGTQTATDTKQISHQNQAYAVLGKPSITADFINKVLEANHSPAAGTGQSLYNLGVKYGIDPAFPLAFFLHESSYGTSGEARKTLSIGNSRCIDGYACVDQDRGGYALFANWEESYDEWYTLIRNYYVGKRGLTTVDKIIPVYAPNADHNNEKAYIQSLKDTIDSYHNGQVKL